MVASLRNGRNVFQNVMGHHGTAIEMAYFKARKVEVRERGYNVLEYRGYPDYIPDVKLPFEVHEGFLKESKDQVFMSTEKSFEKKYALKPTLAITLMPIFNHVNKSLYQTDCTAGKERFAIKHYKNVVYMMREEHYFIGSYLCFPESYISSFFGLLYSRFSMETASCTSRKQVTSFSSRETDPFLKFFKIIVTIWFTLELGFSTSQRVMRKPLNGFPMDSKICLSKDRDRKRRMVVIIEMKLITITIISILIALGYIEHAGAAFFSSASDLVAHVRDPATASRDGFC